MKKVIAAVLSILLIVGIMPVALAEDKIDDRLIEVVSEEELYELLLEDK